MTADLTPSLREAAAVVQRMADAWDGFTDQETAALRLLAGLVPGEGVEVRYGAENVRAYVDGIVAGLTGRQHYVAPLEVGTSGDDRGRELADDPRVRSLIAGAVDQAWRAGATGETGGTADRTDAALRGLRTVAAPAETEAGGDYCRRLTRPDGWQFPLTSTDDITCGTYGCDDDVENDHMDEIDRDDLARLAATPPAPEGEAGSEDDVAMVRCERSDCLGHWVREEAPAGPQAEAAPGDELAHVGEGDPDPTPDAFLTDVAPCSEARSRPMGPFCTRPEGHPGQHLAGGGYAVGIVHAVWPAS